MNFLINGSDKCIALSHYLRVSITISQSLEQREEKRNNEWRKKVKTPKYPVINRPLLEVCSIKIGCRLPI